MNSTVKRVVFFLFVFLFGCQAEAQVRGVLLQKGMFAWRVARTETGYGINYQLCSYLDSETGHAYSYQDIDFNHMPAGKYYMEIPEQLLRADRVDSQLNLGDYRIIFSQRQEKQPITDSPVAFKIPPVPGKYLMTVGKVLPWFSHSYICALVALALGVLVILWLVVLVIRRFTYAVLARIQTLEEEVKRLQSEILIPRLALSSKIRFSKPRGVYSTFRSLFKRIHIPSVSFRVPTRLLRPRRKMSYRSILSNISIPKAFPRIHCAPGLFKRWIPPEVLHLADELSEGFNRTLPRSRRTVRAVPRYNPLTQKATVLVYGEGYPNMGANAGDVAYIVGSVGSEEFECVETLPAKIGLRRREGVEAVYKRK